MTYDAIVIGTGFGGAPAACRLAEAGFKVLVLERGRRWEVDDLPRKIGDPWIWKHDRPEKEHGWFDIRTFGRMGTVAGAGVGGGSLHYANVSISAQPDLFESGWPNGYSLDALQPYYEKVESMLQPKRVPPNQRSNKMALFEKAAKARGFEALHEPVTIAVRFNEDPEYTYASEREPDVNEAVYSPNDEGIEQGTCVHLGNCVIGCEVKARNSLDFNYIPRAERHGAEVRALHLVTGIERHGDGYRVHYDRIDSERESKTPGHADATRVLLAAGSVGSTELLLHCRDDHKTLRNINGRLGKDWMSNANYLTPALHQGVDVYPTRGPTITAAIRFFNENDYGGSHFIVEDGGVPNFVRDIFSQRRGKRSEWGKSGKYFKAVLKVVDELFRSGEKTRHVMPWFAQGRDEATGEFRLRKKWWLFGRKVLRLKWDWRGAEKVIGNIIKVHEELAEATGGKPVDPVVWKVFHALMTPHPLGGCRMADTPSQGVVNGHGEVFGYEHLYVVDGAIIPRAVGHNPSKTIAALGERIAEGIVDREGKSSFDRSA